MPWLLLPLNHCVSVGLQANAQNRRQSRLRTPSCGQPLVARLRCTAWSRIQPVMYIAAEVLWGCCAVMGIAGGLWAVAKLPNPELSSFTVSHIKIAALCI